MKIRSITIFYIVSIFYIVNCCGYKDQELKNCLQEQWGVDSRTADYIYAKMGPILNNMLYHAVIDDFITKSGCITQSINYTCSKEIAPVHPQDGLLQAPKQHIIVFENPWVRILWGSTEPGEHENFHVHAWKSLMLVIKATTFKITHAHGGVEVGDWPIGVYELPEMEHYACTNIGSTADKCLRFEIKT